MKNSTVISAVLIVLILGMATIITYTVQRGTYVGDDARLLEREFKALETEITTLKTAQPLMPIEQQWLAVRTIVENYAGLQFNTIEEHSLLSQESSNLKNGWHAVLVAPPDLLFAVAHLIQQKIPVEVLEIQLNSQQGLLLIHILGVVT